jgi:hypothetical protein
MELQQGEYVIWMDHPPLSYYRYVFIVVGIIAYVALYSLASLLAPHSAAIDPIILVGLIIIIIVTAYILIKWGDKYVVTNIRAMHVKKGKVWKQVYLSTPGLFVTIVNPRYYSDSEESVVSYVVEDVVFLVNGVEVLRFNVTRKGDELIAKLRRMGFQ